MNYYSGNESERLDRKLAGKGEIMRKAFIGKWMGTAFVLMFALALMSMSAGVASAQDTSSWSFAPLSFDVRAGAGTVTVASVSAILGATDAQTSGVGAVFPNGDGSIENTRAGQLIRESAANGGLRLSSRPIIANIQQNERLFMFAVLSGLDAQLVTDIRNNVAGAAQSVINAVSATLPAPLFGADVATSNYVSLPPNRVQAMNTAFDQGFNTNTSVAVIWEGPAALVANATAFNAALNSGVRANLSITGSSAPRARSNWVGASIGAATEVAPIVSKVQILTGTDTTTIPAWTGTAGTKPLGPINPSTFEFRAGDIIHVSATIVANATFDAEPDAYFGTNSDPINTTAGLFNVGTGAGTGSATGMRLELTGTVDNQNLFDPAAGFGFWFTTANGNLILNATGRIADVNTFGPFRNFTVTPVVSDEVNRIANTSATGRVDTVRPAVTGISFMAELEHNDRANIRTLATNAGVINRKKISTQGTVDQIRANINVFPGGESQTDRNWLNFDIAAGPMATPWNSAASNFLQWENFGSTSNSNFDASGGHLVKGNTVAANVGAFPAGTDTTGAQLNIIMRNDINVTLPNAHIIFHVTDDARNQAVVRYPSIDANANRIDIHSITTFNAVSSIGQTRSVNSATFTVDNAPPVIVGAPELSVVAMPSTYFQGFGFSNLSENGLNAFDQLKSTTEVLTNKLNADMLSSVLVGGVPNASQIAANLHLLDVTRGTAALGGPNHLRQSGSPIQMVVTFQPTTTSADYDWKIPGNVAVDTYIQNAFRFGVNGVAIGSASMNYNRKAIGNLDLTRNVENWQFQSASASGGIFQATYWHPDGIPGFAKNVRSGHYPLNVQITDLVWNADVQNSNTIVVDVTRPDVGRVSLGANTYSLVSKTGTAPTTVVLVTSTGGPLLNNKFDLDTVSLASLAGPGGNAFAFRNSAGTIVGHASPVANVTGPARVRAGDYIIVSATFQESGTYDLFATYGRRGAFPYVLTTNEFTEPEHYLDRFGRLYGREFRTIAADFSMFDTASGSVLPDVTRNITPVNAGAPWFNPAPGRTVGNPAPGDIIQATWFYRVNPTSETLNGNIAASVVRGVTLIARDLSGNIKRDAVPVGVADFGFPQLAILGYKISTANRGVSNATIQVDPTYNNARFGTASAIQISAATAIAGTGDNNTGGSVLTLVVRAENVTAIGDLRANFSAFSSGATSVAPTSTSSSAGIGYATWVHTVAQGAPNLTNTDSAVVTVTAISPTDTQRSVTTVPIQVDKLAPSVVGSSIVVTEVETYPGDILNDNIIRIGQALIVDATVLVNAYEGNLNVLNGFTFIARFSAQTGISTQNATIRKIELNSPSGTGDRPHAVGIRFNLTVPSNANFVSSNVNVRARDMAGNEGNANSPQLLILDREGPVVADLDLEIRTPVNYVGGQNQSSNSFREVAAGANNAVGIGDEVRVVVDFDPRDVAFNLPANFENTITADFSQFNGNANVPAEAVTSAGPVLVATFVAQVTDSNTVIRDASVTVNIADPSGLAATNNIRTVTVSVDTIVPQLSVDVTFYQNGEVVEELIGDAPGTAEIFVTALYPDVPVFDFIDGPGAVLAGALAAGLGGNASAELVALNFSDFNEDLETVAPTYLTISNTAGQVITRVSGGADIPASAFPGLANSRGHIVSAWFGLDPRSPGNTSFRLPITATSLANAQIVAQATDAVGNAGIASTTGIFIDNQPPSVRDIVLNVAPEAEEGEFLPQLLAADGSIIRPTRVSGGTPMSLNFVVEEQPNPEDGGFGRVFLNEFGASSAPFVFGPTAAEMITIDFVVGGGASTTFGINPSNPQLASSYQLTPAANVANAIIAVTDTRGNEGTFISQNLIEVDTQGPVVAQSGIVAVNSLVDFDIITPAQIRNLGSFVNAAPGQWIVYAATVVIDGTETVNGDLLHLQNLNVDFATALPSRIAETTQSIAIVESISSVTRAVAFVKVAARLTPNAISSAPVQAVVNMEDFFGNPAEDLTGGAVTTGSVGISARGPRAVEVVLTVNGLNRLMPGVNVNSLGIGSGGPDAVQASFEMAPGNRVIVDATLTTFNNDVPSIITANLSDLYPPQLRNSVDEVLPTRVELTDQGVVRARWERILTFGSGLAGSSIGSGTTYFADRSIFSATTTNNYNYATEMPFLFAGNILPTTVFRDARASGDTATNAQLASLRGLPFIQLQNSATPKMVASVTITVDDDLSPFQDAERTRSTTFATDSREPTANYTLSVVDRALEPSVLNETGPRAGFPATPNLLRPISEVPNRVRQGDTLRAVVTLQNPTINLNGNDRFIVIPAAGEPINPRSFFTLAASSVLNVTANLSEFNTALNNVYASVGGTVNTVTIGNVTAGQPTTITATYQFVVSGDVGTSVAASSRVRNITPTILDDAGNAPRNNAFESNNLVRGTDLAVDNTPPSISGSILVLDSNGNEVSGGSVIQPGETFTVRVTITDLVDNPLDVLQNLNFGPASLTIRGFDQPTVIPDYDNAQFTGPNSIELPFIVVMPAAEEANSAEGFAFIISATDTIGNSASVESFDTFDFDARPAITITSSQTNLNVGQTTEVTVNAFDVGGLTTLEVTHDGNGGIIVEPINPADGLSVDATTTGTRNLSVTFNVTPTLAAVSPVFTVMGSATDEQGLSDTRTFTFNVNQPAMFAEVFDVTTTTAAGDVTTATIVASATGYNVVAGEDVREVSVDEGATVVLGISASDVFGDDVNFAASGSALDFGTLESDGDGTATFTFSPDFTAVIGDATSAIYELVLSANDGSTIDPDLTTILFNVLPQFAQPTLALVSVSIGGVPVDTSFGSTVEVLEGQTLELVVTGNDPGLDELALLVTTDPSGIPVITDVVNDEVGNVTGTISVTPGFQYANTEFDPFSLTVTVANDENSASGTLDVDVVNVGQDPVITTEVTYGDQSQLMQDGGTITVDAGASVQFTVVSQDLDGTALLLPEVLIQSTNPNVTRTDLITTGSGSELTTTFTVNIPADICSGEAMIAVVFSATNVIGLGTTERYNINVNVGFAGGYDELIVSTGLGGRMVVNIRNIDPNPTSTTPSGAVPGLTSVLRSYYASPEAARNDPDRGFGGGDGRPVYVATGDINGDGTTDIVTTLGPITEGDARFPNIVIVRDSQTRMVVGHSFTAFPKGDDLLVQHNSGDVKVAVGNFTGTAPDQIAVAQGLGGNGVIRIYQYTGQPAPNGYAVIAQFQGLSNAARAANANGGINIAAGDLDGDGIDELLVGQTNSETSQTQFQLIDIDVNGAVTNRVNFTAFQANFRNEQGAGVDFVICDLDGDGNNEIVASAQGTGVSAAGGAQMNLIQVLRPVIGENGNVTGFTRPSGGVRNVFSVTANPSGSTSIGYGEFDNCSGNGCELIVGTGSLWDVDGDADTGFDITPVLPAPQSKYRVIKLDTTNGSISGPNPVFGSPLGQDAFVAEWNPTSGAVDVAGANTD